MAAQTDLNALLRVPGRLCVNPTNLALGFPGGGTDLGLVRDIVALPGREVETLIEEGMGVQIIDAVTLGESWAIAAVLAGEDQGVMDKIFSSTATSSAGDKEVVYPATDHLDGKRLGESAVKLLFWPEDDAQLFVYFPRALGFVDVGAEIAHQIGTRFGIPVTFLSTPAVSGGKAVYRQRKENLVL